MTYDEDLADRIRGVLGTEKNLTEQKMFGGLGFMINGNMAVAASGQGGLMVRVDPVAGEKLVATTKAEPMEMKGRSMTGWLQLDVADLRTPTQLKKWVSIGADYARALPPKKK